MLRLALETSSRRGSVALFDGSQCLRESLCPEGLVHGREIPARVQEVLVAEGLEPGQLGCLAVSQGPGSFTGIRVGVTVAKTLAHVLRIPIVVESSLRVIAANASAALDPGPVLVSLDARQGLHFWALFRISADRETSLEARVERLYPDSVGDPTEIAAQVALALPGESPPEIIGESAEALLAALGPAGFRRGPPEWDLPTARTLGLLTPGRSQAARFDEELVHRLEPAYLRTTEAERKLAARGST